MLGNLPAHKVTGVPAAGARLLYLPPFSPGFNPTEQAFAKLKALLCKAVARTIYDRRNAIGRASTAFMPLECWNDFITA